MRSPASRQSALPAPRAPGVGQRTRPLRLTVLDYSGHPCQVQLSRTLGSRGHRVEHLHCPQYRSGKGSLERLAGDSETFSVAAVGEPHEVERYRLRARLTHEVRFAQSAVRSITAAAPDAVVLSNVPLLAHYLMARRLARCGVPMVFWHQDVYSQGIRQVAERRLGRLGSLVGVLADRAEGAVARRSAAVVPISPAFVRHLHGWGVPDDAITVIPNWAAIEEMPRRARDNAWARRHDLVGRPVVLYTGTLGLKHNPGTLLDLARVLARDVPEGRVVVVSQGPGRTWLEEHAEGLAQLVLLDYQPYQDLPDVLASAEVLVCLLEPGAGAYSVPSKILNYLCAGRSILAVVPAVNGAAQMVEAAGAGAVVAAGDAALLERTLLELLADGNRRAAAGERGRAFAERTFDVDAIADSFESILTEVTDGEPVPSADRGTA